MTAGITARKSSQKPAICSSVRPNWRTGLPGLATRVRSGPRSADSAGILPKTMSDQATRPPRLAAPIAITPHPARPVAVA